jgi:hypothetical protein
LTRESGIYDTLVRFCWAIDAGDADGVAACFADGGQMVGPGGTVIGRAAIRTDTEGKREARAARGIVRHLVCNVLIEGGAESAQVRSVFLATVRTEAAVSILASGEYEDSFVKPGDAWLIERRITRLDAN